ncbi:MAG: hypothetical protein A2Y84_00625 [Candidatus Colwellbacteria bacterium RBG_13_48_8]|uniref:Glycosyltransferase subfamily 4-like N-terminal domain-containing protein n=1 Tax=Candidatus Colwellbacteria bacterium RBG_13_48_8 TaxID=1797685 RepID=A0A1G1YZA8_9BACT|nr:MAG: hypothetical protein A2Y84_00625 [Candidatus Colwellbacteria bacterium RBG_13_48_8]
MNVNQLRKKKLLLVLNNFQVGGVERLMLDILSRLDRDKFGVEIATVVGTGPLEGEFRKLGFPIHLTGPSFDQGKRLFSKVRWVILTPLTLWKLIGIMRRIKVDLVLTCPYQADLLGILAAKMAGVEKRILVQTDVAKLSPVRRFLKKWLSIVLSTKIIAISAAVKDYIVNTWMAPAGKIEVIYPGIDFEKFRAKRKPGRISTIGIVGRLEEIRGPDIFAKAAIELKTEYLMEPDILFVGDGSMRGSLEELVDSQLSKAQFVGSVLNVREWLSKIDLLVVPSRSEGFGLILVEGLLSKCLMVASDIPVFREIINDKNKSNLLFPVGDYKILAKLLAEILKDPQKQNVLRGEIDEWIKKESHRFDIEKMAKSYEALLG